MRRHSRARSYIALLGATLALGMAAAPVQANDPLFVYVPTPPEKPPIVPPPTGYLNGSCGVTVDSTGRFYVSDYYHHVIDLFFPGSPAPTYVTQVSNVDPLGGPCNLALDSASRLYVNNYHRNVVRYNIMPSFGAGTVITGVGIDDARPTGVASDPATGTIYVNSRTYISAFDLAGNPVLHEGEPLKIGLGTLGDGYGLAVSQFAGTMGRLYVPDAVSNTVKVYDPAADKVNPIAEIKDPSGKPFISLRDSAIAVDRVTGEVYFADNTQPQYAERPRTSIYIFGPTGLFKGRLKYQVVHGQSAGIAIDNSEGATQGRVYVTSGNTNQGGVYAYAPGSGFFGPPLPPTFGLSVWTGGTGFGSVTSAVAKLDCESACERQLLSGGEVTLSAAPDPGSAFTGWSGDCSGTQPSCTVTMDEAASVSAGFAELPASAPPITSLSSSSPTAAVTPRQIRSRREARCRAAKRRHRSAQRKGACRRHRSTSRR